MTPFEIMEKATVTVKQNGAGYLKRGNVAKTENGYTVANDFGTYQVAEDLTRCTCGYEACEHAVAAALHEMINN